MLLFSLLVSVKFFSPIPFSEKLINLHSFSFYEFDVYHTKAISSIPFSALGLLSALPLASSFLLFFLLDTRCPFNQIGPCFSQILCR